MNNHKVSVVDGVYIGAGYWDMPVRIQLRAYLRFSRRLDSQLRRLVVRWAYAASPAARGVPVADESVETSVPPIEIE